MSLWLVEFDDRFARLSGPDLSDAHVVAETAEQAIERVRKARKAAPADSPVTSVRLVNHSVVLT